MNINHIIANELSVKLWQVDAAIKLIDEGNTIPFIARYRKPVTGIKWWAVKSTWWAFEIS